MNTHFLFKLSMSFVIVIVLISCKSNNSTVTYNLISSVEPSQAGAISPASGEFEDGEVISVTATANENWEFVEWGGDLSGTSNPASVTIDDDKTISATFKLKEYPLTVNVEGEGTITETLVQSKSTDYPFGSVVELMAEANDEWQFVEWSGDLTGSENPAEITVDREKTVTALFEFGFSEDFESGNNGMWILSDSRASITNGALQIQGDNRDQWAGAYYDKMYSNFKVEVEVVRIESELSPFALAIFTRSSAYGQNPNGIPNGYEFAITQWGDGVGGSTSFWLTEDGEFEALLDWNENENIVGRLGSFNKLTVNANGNQIDLFINDVYVGSVLDNIFSTGYIGLATFDGEYDEDEEGGPNIVLYDNVKVSLPDEPVAKPKFFEANSNVQRSVNNREAPARLN